VVRQAELESNKHTEDVKAMEKELMDAKSCLIQVTILLEERALKLEETISTVLGIVWWCHNWGGGKVAHCDRWEE
jgi:hypothetical protein